MNETIIDTRLADAVRAGFFVNVGEPPWRPDDEMSKILAEARAAATGWEDLILEHTEMIERTPLLRENSAAAHEAIRFAEGFIEEYGMEDIMNDPGPTRVLIETIREVDGMFAALTRYMNGGDEQAPWHRENIQFLRDSLNRKVDAIKRAVRRGGVDRFRKERDFLDNPIDGATHRARGIRKARAGASPGAA